MKIWLKLFAIGAGVGVGILLVVVLAVVLNAPTPSPEGNAEACGTMLRYLCEVYQRCA